MRLSAMLVLAAGASALAPSPASACSCIRLPGADPAGRARAHVESAPYVFRAEVEAARYREEREPPDVLMSVRVTERIKGEVPERLELITDGPFSSCATELARLPEAKPQEGRPLALITVMTDLNAQTGRGYYSYCSQVGLQAPSAVYEALFDSLRSGDPAP